MTEGTENTGLPAEPDVQPAAAESAEQPPAWASQPVEESGPLTETEPEPEVAEAQEPELEPQEPEVAEAEPEPGATPEAPETASEDADELPADGEPDAEPEPEPDAIPEEPEAATEDAPADPGQTDDLSAAIAAANENLESDETFDDIAPGTVAAAAAAAAGGEAGAHVSDAVSIWPFVVYDVLWAVYAGVLIWQFRDLPANMAVYESPLYPTALIAGVALTAMGPALILATWIASWGRDGASKFGLFVSALIKGAIATIIGVGLWWGALLVLDQLRLGRLL